MIKPIFTEKSLAQAKKGRYYFWVDNSMDKGLLKALISKTYGVEVVAISTLFASGEAGRNARGRKFNHLKSKKAVVSLKKGQKLEIFEPKKK